MISLGRRTPTYSFKHNPVMGGKDKQTWNEKLASVKRNDESHSQSALYSPSHENARRGGLTKTLVGEDADHLDDNVIFMIVMYCKRFTSIDSGTTSAINQSCNFEQDR